MKIPHTIESLKIKNETTVDVEKNELICNDFNNNEFSEYYKQTYESKVLITYVDNSNRKTRIFGRELTRIIPNFVSLYRNKSSNKKIVRSAIKKEFTDILITNENKKEPDELLTL
ncbi:Brix domain containing protein, partial [Asbolus verrucosus]